MDRTNVKGTRWWNWYNSFIVHFFSLLLSVFIIRIAFVRVGFSLANEKIKKRKKNNSLFFFWFIHVYLLISTMHKVNYVLCTFWIVHLIRFVEEKNDSIKHCWKPNKNRVLYCRVMLLSLTFSVSAFFLNKKKI